MKCRIAADLVRKDIDDERRLDELEQKQERIDKMAHEMMFSAIDCGKPVFWESITNLDKIDEIRLRVTVAKAIEYVAMGEVEKRLAYELLGEFMLDQITNYIFPIMQELAQDDLS